MITRHESVAVGRFRTSTWLGLLLAITILAGMLDGCASSAGPTTNGAAQFVGFGWRIGEVQHGTDRIYRPTNVGTTFVSYVGHDPARAALIRAIEVLTRSNATVTADLHGERLRLATAGYTITCTKLGPAPEERPASPSSTRS